MVYYKIKSKRMDIVMKPRVFVSSTFYDLKYIREDLSNFIISHDFEPIMFEFGDVGYTPGKPLDESCYDTMRTSDMVILIIGGAYGSCATGEDENFDDYISVTRNEFKTAVEEGIPVFAFIDSKVWSEFGVYEVNLKAIELKKVNINFKATDNINVFKFIKEIRSVTNIPITEFTKAADIKCFLSKQWADMFKSYLKTLRDAKQAEMLENSVAKINTMVSEMGIMLNEIGKKVLKKDGSEKEYKDVLERQKEVKLKIASTVIRKNIKIANSTEDATKDIEIILAAIQNMSKVAREKYNEGCTEIKELEPYLVGILFKKIEESDLRIIRIGSDLIYNWELFEEIMSHHDIKVKLIESLSKAPYYLNIFNLKTRDL